MTRKIAQLSVLLFSLVTTILFLISIPTYYHYIKNQCIDEACDEFNNPPPGTDWLLEQGLTPATFSFAYVSIYTVFGLVYITSAFFLFYKKRNDTMGFISIIMLISLGGFFTSIMGGLTSLSSHFKIVINLTGAIGMVAFILFFFLFPNGRFAPKWSMYLCFFLLGLRIPGMVFPDTPVDLHFWPPWVFILWFCMWLPSMIFIQIYRYRTILTAVEKQQAKWAVFGMILAIGGLFILSIIYLSNNDRFEADPLKTYYMEMGIHTVMLLIPFTLIIAVTRHRLWDIDKIVNRTIVYGVMTLSTVTVYILGVWYTSLLFQTKNHLLTSLIATGIVAVLFAPIKAKVQRLINRMMYGKNDDPFSVIVDLAKELEDPLEPEEVLQMVTKNIRQALRIPYVSLSLHQNGTSVFVAEDGNKTEDVFPYPLVYRGEEMGALLLSARSPGEVFTSSDKKLIDMLVHQSSVIIQSVKVSMDLKLLAVDLQDSREKLVLAREEERRKIRANLHDDLAPRLAALALTSGAAESLVESNPQATKNILAELRSTIRLTVSDIRGLVYDLRPPTLDEMGLIGAIHERIKELSHPNPTRPGESISFVLQVPEDLPALPAAVEVAAFRIVSEAIVNVSRHSEAKNCTINIKFEKDKGLLLHIKDDGKGMKPKSKGSDKGGIGLGSMKERATELGGSLKIESNEQIGTSITVFLPVTIDQIGGEK